MKEAVRVDMAIFDLKKRVEALESRGRFTNATCQANGYCTCEKKSQTYEGRGCWVSRTPNSPANDQEKHNG